ncbi:hypothetical protein [Roseivirga spongicola]|uniref:hypothetical protein n=1 Tax=Roseivirga spongicola TaxID=333140 RepID=UPI002AC8F7A2|nr:hypothetical protein [Roseivirga spongicola]WPZ08773.1 hypothetical protein T7867_10940 [Roseivirga spongicola]
MKVGQLEINGASPKFLEYLEKHIYPPLSKGEVDRFELLNVRDESGKPKKVTLTSVSILSEFMVYDHFAKKSVRCNWVVGERLADLNAKGEATKVTAKVKFTKVGRGSHIIPEGRVELYELRKLLSIHPQNKDNKGKDWHISPGKYKFSKFDEHAAAEKNAEKRSAKGVAIVAVETMDSSERLKLAESIFGAKTTAAMKGVQIRAKLLEVADETPEKIVGGTSGKITNFSDYGALIEAAVKQEVIKKHRHKIWWFAQNQDEKPLFDGVPNGGALDAQFTDYLKDNPNLLRELRTKVSLG